MRSVGYISLGCPKATVDSERLLTGLAEAGVQAAEGIADVTVVNTCGFIDAARDESLDTIAELLAAGSEVVVTGCLGREAELLRSRFPTLKHVSGPAQADAVVRAVLAESPSLAPLAPAHGPAGVKLTPPHYSYLKISEGCNHKCTFCIIPQLRGGLRSRPIDDVLREADQLAARGTREVLVIAQDTSAYGLDIGYASRPVGDQMLASRIEPLARALGERFDWVRLHYVYPYPHVDDLIPLMADGLLLPYLDMPLQHASPDILRAMRRPAAVEKVLDRLQRWRQVCPDIAIRSTFIVGFPGETDEDFAMLLDFLEEAQLDRVGCFTYSEVDGAAANALPDHVPHGDRLDRQEVLLEVQAAISAEKLAKLVGRRCQVLVDAVDGDVAIGRSERDAPEVDGQVFIADGASLRPGDLVWVRLDDATEHDLHASLLGQPVKMD
jgi:ribosomal protein S12 methylthiotransferase